MEQESFAEITLDEPFCFDCNSGVECFNECCRDLNQFLTPYDVIRLKNHFDVSSSRFLNHYTIRHTGPQTGLPVITLKPADPATLKCPFVTPSGCRVYENRPSSCRMYPIIRVVAKSRETGKKTIRFALLKELHCQGFQQQKRVTVREWMPGQGLETYNEINDLMMDIISTKNRFLPGPLKGEMLEQFYTICYDIDGFRKQMLTAEGKRIDVTDAEKDDDVELLRAGMKYLRDKVFGRENENK